MRAILDLRQKFAAFCRAAGNGDLDITWPEGDSLYASVWAAFKNGAVDAAMEADLDKLNELVRKLEHRGFYPEPSRGYGPLPDGWLQKAEARWWACPVDRCAGYGRVRGRERPPTCAATGEILISRPV
jgi:hypothetical protein